MILDPRTAVEIAEGGTITFAFGTKDVLRQWWRPMKIARTEGIEEIIALMESENFGMNVVYETA
jgi:hypothetical protein